MLSHSVLLFGATGMVGQAVLIECLRDDRVASVLAVGRRSTGVAHPKLREIVHTNFLDYSSIESELAGHDACLWCLGISSVGMSEDEYRRITYDYTVAAAATLARLNPSMTFVYVSGAGSDSSGRGKVMWARVKGAAENAVLAMPFARSYVVRPAIIEPLDGIVPGERWIRFLYRILRPLFPLIRAAARGYVTTSREVARAMLNLAFGGDGKRILESRDLRAAAME